jgi:hypothetical protein
MRITVSPQRGQADPFVGLELCRLAERRQPRSVQNFIAVGIADAAHDARICERATARHDVHGGAPFRTGLGQHQRAGVEIDGCQLMAPGEFHAGRAPMEPAGDHQMNHDPQVAFESDRDTFSYAFEPEHAQTLESRDRRFGRTQQEGTRDPHALDDATRDPCLECVQIRVDVGKLGHEDLAQPSLDHSPCAGALACGARVAMR